MTEDRDLVRNVITIYYSRSQIATVIEEIGIMTKIIDQNFYQYDDLYEKKKTFQEEINMR